MRGNKRLILRKWKTSWCEFTERSSESRRESKGMV